MIADSLKSKEELLVEIQNLRLRHAELQSMFPMIITSLEDQKVLSINASAAYFFGIPEKTILGFSALEYWYHPEERSAFRAKVVKNGRISDFEACLKTHSGDKRHVLLSANIISYENQSATCTIITDITFRKEVEQALQQSQARYQKLYNLTNILTEAVPDMIWAKDINDCYLFANKAIRKKLLMCDKGESPIGKNDIFFAKRERQRGYIHTFGEICLNSDEIVKKECKADRFLEDGLVRNTYLVLDVYKSPMFDERGELIGTVGVGRDVTRDIEIQDELQKSARRLRLLANNVRDVIWATDDRLNITYVTPSIYDLSGYTPEEFLQIPPQNHLTPSFQRIFRAIRRFLLTEVRDTQNPPTRLWEFEWRKKDGGIIWVEASTSAMYKQDGTFEGFVCVTRETTKKVLAQRELETAKEAALAASRSKSDFLANMSHEIRTPMNGVLGMLQLLRQTRLTSEQKEFVETALNSGTSLLKIISEILDFSKIEAGKIQLEANHFSLHTLVASVTDSLKSLMDHDKVSLTTHIDDNVPACIIADEARLRQILYNLIGNSVKFTPQGNITIDLSAAGKGKNEVRLFFKIIDTGIGFSSQETESLFEPFVQADGSFRRKYQGTGLGLSIVRRLVTLMQGKISISSDLGEGTIVSFDILVKPSLKIDQKTGSTINICSSRTTSLRILVVEDENINALVVTSILKKLGHIPTLVDSGRLALEILRNKHFDCILMDIQMPEMDGIETARAIRSTLSEKCCRIPIIALTAHAMKGDRERFLGAGMNDYLTKPVEINDLVQVLQSYSHFPT